jgi:hypothetical protein
MGQVVRFAGACTHKSRLFGNRWLNVCFTAISGYVSKVPIARITRNVFDHREWPTRLVDVRSRNEACASA